MSNTILNKIPSPFMSALPPDIRIQTTNPYVDVAFWTGNRTLLKERYYAYNGYVTLHDLRSLIEAEMRSAGSALMTFILKAYKDSQTNETDTYTFTVLYCDRYIAEGYPSQFLSENFLTTLPMHRIGPKTHITLGYFLRSGESTALRVDFLYRVPDGGIETGIYTHSGGTVTADRVYSLDLLQQTLLESVAERERCKFHTPHSALHSRKRVRKFAIFSRIPTVDSTYYPIPYYASLFKGKWYNIKLLIGVAKEAKLKNSAPIKYHIEIAKTYWD